VPHAAVAADVHQPLDRAAHLAPPLTTLRQPLVQLGHTALTTLIERVRRDGGPVENRLLQGELVIRRSSGAPAPKT